MAALPSLVVNLALDSAQFVDGLTKAEYQAKKSAEDIKNSIEHIGHTFEAVAAAVGVGLGVNEFKELVLGALEAEEQLQLLGARAGITGEQLSAFIEVSRKAHTDLETVATASARLSKALLDFGNDNAKATQVLTALGLSAKDVAGLLDDPAAALLKVAKLLDTLPEGGTKAASQLLILGRAGGSTAALMEELAKQQSLVAIRTQEDINAAKEFNEKLIELGVNSDSLKTQFANALVPTLTAAATAMLEIAKSSDGVKANITALAADGSLRNWAEGTVLFLATVVESFLFLGRTVVAVVGSFRGVAAEIEYLNAKANAPSQKITGSFGFSDKEAAEGEAAYQAAKKRRDELANQADQNYIELIKKNATKITDALKASFAQQRAAEEAILNLPANSDRNDRLLASVNSNAAAEEAKRRAANAKRVQDALNSGNTGGEADAAARKALEGYLKNLDAGIESEKSLLRERETFLTDYYSQGDISIKDYYDRIQSVRDEALKKTIEAYNKEIDATAAYQAAATKATDKQAAENKLNEIVAKQDKASQDAVFAANQLSVVRSNANRKYADELDELNAKLLELQGNTAAAAAIRFDNQTRGLALRLSSEGNDYGLAQLAAIRERLQLQDRLNEETRQFGLIQSGLAVEQGYVTLAQNTGAISEATALTRISELNRERLGQLQATADAYAKIAASPFATQEQILQAQQMKLAVEQLAAQTDLLADKFNKGFSDAFSSALTDFVTHTKTAKEAFNDFIKQVTKQISDVASQNIATAIFGKGGIGAGAGDFLSKLFGGTGGGSSSNSLGGAYDPRLDPRAPGSDTSAVSSLLSGLLGKAAGGGAQAAADAATSAANAAALSAAAASLTAAGAGLTASGLTLDSAGISLAAAATALTASAAASGISSSASGVGSIIGAFIPAGGGLAGGTDFASGGPTLVGEHGPEIVNLPRGARVTPNDQIGNYGSGVKNLSIVVNVPPGTSGASADQIALRTGAVVQRSLARNG